MSQKSLDRHGRHRNRTVAFRVSPEESEQLTRLAKASGLTKQDYIVSKVLDRGVNVVPSSRTYKGLFEVMRDVYCELRRIRDASELTPYMEETLNAISNEFIAFRGDIPPSEMDLEDVAIRKLTREWRRWTPERK